MNTGTASGMAGKSFKGNLEVLNLSDIFQSLAMNRHSGTLIVTDGKREKKIFFAEGEITLLSSSRRQRLGELLVNSGKITEDDLDLALKLQKQSRKRLGEILVEEGFCEEEDIDRLVRMQIEEEIYDLFLWRKAEFEFIADQMPEDMARESPNLTRLALNTNSLIMEALRRLDEWNLIRNLVPSTKEVFVLTNQPGLETCDVPERIKSEAVGVVDGRTTVEGLAERFFVSEFELCKHLAEMCQAGVLRALTQEELADRAEECYVLNDFVGAAALYGRLAEYFPDQPKILTPLADSLRRTGAEKQALTIYEQLAQQLEASGRDPDRLRQCYEAITQLDPTRVDLVRKLEDFDLQSAVAPGRRRLWPLVVGAAALGVVVLGVVFRGPIAAALSGGRPAATGEGEAAKLLDSLNRARLQAINAPLGPEGSEAYEAAVARFRRWHELAWQLYREHPRSRESAKATFPLLVATEPAGFEVYINRDLEGYTQPDQPFIACESSQVAGAQVRICVPLEDGREGRQLAERRVADPSTWPGVLRFPLVAKPRSTFIADNWLDAGLVRSEVLGAILAPSRDGKLRVLSLADGRPKPVQPWDELPLGEVGDLFTRPQLLRLEDGRERLVVGATEGGVLAVDLSAAGPGEQPVQRLYPADAQVAATPLALPEGVVLATLTGEVLAYPLAGRQPIWRNQLDAPVSRPLVHLDGRVIVAGEDAAVRALDLSDGAERWVYHARRPLTGDLQVLGGDVLVPLEGGRLVLLDAEDGEQVGVYDEPEGAGLTAVRAGSRGQRVYVATEAGVLRALSRELRPVWPRDRVLPSKEPPRLEAVEGLVVAAIGASGHEASSSHPGVVAYDQETGRVVWQGYLEGRVNSPVGVFGELVVVGTDQSPGGLVVFERGYR